MQFNSINPATGATLRSYEESAPTTVAALIEGADRAFQHWRSLSFSERAKPMRRVSATLRERAREYARLMTEEMGKPIRDGIAEAQKCAQCCEYFAEHSEAFLARETVDIGAARSFVTFQPLGVILAIMPWNFPFWQVFRFAAPTLMAGNAAILKHASNVPGCTLALAELFAEAGFPEHLFAAVLIGSKRVDAIIEDRRIRAVTLTGSVDAGRAIARKAGEMLKKTVLELGGSDAYLVLEDADIEVAAELSAKGRLVNSGQSCIAAKRFIVVDKVRARFEELFVQQMRAAKVGDPMSQSTEVGPLARRDLRDALHQQVQASIAKGARCLVGGAIPEGPGAYYPPTVLTDVRPGMPAYEQELFGPVAAVIAAPDEPAAIRIANDSVFGLGAGVFSGDLDRATRIAAEEIEAGSVFVNATVQSNPRLPFGGVKESGYGRELSAYGIKEFVNIKSVVAETPRGSKTRGEGREKGRTE
ncbi:MAG: Succinate-semialdehyde dehydrogenase [Gammaproteobacteria bacterium]|nr:Succinate-semialdehyde dehydrogenase [Gammaproteobacteria bacterium]